LHLRQMKNRPLRARSPVGMSVALGLAVSLTELPGTGAEPRALPGRDDAKALEGRVTEPVELANALGSAGAGEVCELGLHSA
jgi:hypothetical protein